MTGALDSTFAALRGRLQAPTTADELRPPPRFIDKTFSDYRVDTSIAGQSEAIDSICGFVAAGPRRFWQLHRRRERSGLYLDGDFGVGKTHLLAASWNAQGHDRRYLSFAEAISLVVLRGLDAAIELLAAELVCIDEFELDDPSNTRLADLLLDSLGKRGSRIMVTSNTVPGELGAGRLFVDQFRRQLQRVAKIFDDVHVPGHDYRQRERRSNDERLPGWGPDIEAWKDTDEYALCCTADELDELLRDVPVLNLRRLAAIVSRVSITRLDCFDDQLQALRFVHLIDRLYEWRVPLRVRASCRIEELFAPSYRELGFAKKYRRCQSRLVELCGSDLQAAAS